MFDFLRNLTKSAEEKKQEAISAYLDGAATPAERRRFEQQLARDPGLQVDLEQQRRLQQALRQLPRRPVPRSFTLDPARYGRPQPQPLVPLYPALRLATALTAVFLVAVVALDLFTPAAAPSFSGAAEPAADTVSMAVEVTRVVTEEITVEGESVEVTRVIEDVVVAEEEAAPEAEAVEEPVEEETASEGELLTLEATEDATATVMGRTLEAPASSAAEMEPVATAPLPAATPVPDLAETANATVDEADEAPAQTFSDTDVGPTGPTPLSTLRKLQLGLGAAFVLLALITFLARRQL